MCTLYKSIISLCQEKGIKGGRMCTELGLSKSLLSDLKSGRKKGITSDTAQKIADYFSVSVDRVLNGPDTKKAPTQEGERQVSDDEIKIALWGTKEINDDVLDRVKQFAKFAQEEEKSKNP